jgi:hypothetical protein
MSLPASGTIFLDHRRLSDNFRITGIYMKAGTSFLYNVTGMIFRISSNFIEASRNFIFFIFYTKDRKNFIRAQTTRTAWFDFKNLKK